MAVRHLPYCVRGDFTCPTSNLPADVKSPRPGVFFNVCESFHQVCGRRRRRTSKDLLGDIWRLQSEESEDHARRRVKEDGANVILLRGEPASGDSPHANDHAATTTSSLPVLGCRRSRQLVWSDSSLDYTLYADRGGSGQRPAARRRVDVAPSFSMTRNAAAATKDVHKVVQDKLWVECRPVTLSAKKPPPGTMVALPCPGTPRGRGERFEDRGEESPRAQKPRFHYTVRLPERVRHRRCLVPVGGTVWEEEEDAPRSSSHLLPRLAEPPRQRPSCARSVGGADQRGGVNHEKACRNSTYSEPVGIHAFTYIDRVLHWLRQVPADPLVYGADTEGPCSGATPRASRLDNSAVTANSQPHHQDMTRDLLAVRLDLPSLAPPTCLAASDPANGAPVPPRPSTPWDARASMASGSISRPTTAKSAAAEGLLACGEGASSKGSFYPLNLMTSSSFERVSRHSGRLDMSPRPPNPSPCSTRSFAASSSSSYSSPSPLSAPSRTTSPGLDLGLRCEADETSFNTTERTHDRLSTNYFSSPDGRNLRQGGPPASMPSLTLGINVQPNVSVRYRRQPQEIIRPAQLRIVAKPSKKVARHVFKPSSRRAMKKRKKKKQLAAHAHKDGAKTKKKKRNPSGDPKKSTAAVKVIKKALRLLKRKKRGLQSRPRQGRCVLRALSPPRSPHSASSLTICETFQKVVGLTAQMRIDAIWTHTDYL